MEQKEFDKWNERYFQLVCALISRETSNARGHASSNKIAVISHRADVMIEFLKKREAGQKHI